MQFQNDIHKDYTNAITVALKAKTEDELNNLFQNANNEFDESLAQLQRENKEIASRRERKTQSSGVTFAEKTLKPITVKIKRKMESDGYKRKVAKWTPEMKNSEVQYLDELIEMAQSMKAMIENAE